MTNAENWPTQGHGALFRILTDGFVDWLATATDSRGARFADTYGIANHDTFWRGAEGMHDRIQMLVDEAQSDAILHSADHGVLLWQVADEGFLLTIDGPRPPRLCSWHLSIDDLVPDKASGSVAALAVLMSVAQVANELLTEHGRTRAATTGATAFPSIRQGTPVDPSLMTTSTSPPVGRPHHGR